MCLIVLAHRLHPVYRLVFAANRDEFYGRPTAPASYWDEAPGLLAGRDLQAGGTWCGMTRDGRWAAVTNYREPGETRPDAPSRGALVTGFLTSEEAPAAFLGDLIPKAPHYNGFNLLAGEGADVFYFSNRGGAPRPLTPGLYGLSNHLLDTPWPKVVRARERLAALLEADHLAPEPLLDLMHDAEPALDAELPQTGVGLEWERLLSSPFIKAPSYGTRLSTVVLVTNDGQATFVERTYPPDGAPPSTLSYDFEVAPA